MRNHRGGWRRGAALVLAAALQVLVVATPPSAVHADPLPIGVSRYQSVAPDRLADTRPSEGAYGFTRLSDRVIRVQVTGRSGVPAGAVAAVLTLTATNASQAGYVTAYAAGSLLPLASSLNVDQPGRVIANLATVSLSADGAVELYTNVPMDLVVDVAGAYLPVGGAVAAGRVITFPEGARRALDTRDLASPLWPGELREVAMSTVGVPGDATAVVLNVGVTATFAAGFWTAYPAGTDRPPSSTVNVDDAWQTRNAQAIVRLEPGRPAVTFFSQSGGHLIVDVVGYVTGEGSPVSTDGLFVPRSTPLRVLDTRKQFPIAPWGGSTIEYSVQSPFPDSTAAAAVNITVVEPLNVGFVTAFPAGLARPLAANVNVDSLDQIIANHGTVRMATRGGSLFTQSGVQMIVDVSGWYLGTPEVSGPAAPSPDFGITQSTRIISSVLDTKVGYGWNIDAIVDRGLAGLYVGTGRLGVPEHNIYFAHRTRARGPFRHLDRMAVGSTFVITGDNGHSYVYLVMETAIINPIPSVLLAMSERAGRTTATLVACHPPGSIRQRIVVTGRLIGAF